MVEVREVDVLYDGQDFQVWLALGCTGVPVYVK